MQNKVTVSVTIYKEGDGTRVEIRPETVSLTIEEAINFLRKMLEKQIEGTL